MNQLCPLVVEFVGLPGAGKTTVFREVVSQLRDKGIEVIARDEMLQQWQSQSTLQRLLKLIPKTPHQWVTLGHCLWFAAQVKPLNLASFLKAVKLFANAKRLDAISPSEERRVVLLDQGLLQEVWSVSITGSFPSQKQIDQVLACILQQRCLAVVEFKIDVETALHRIQSRPTVESRFDQMQPEEARSRLLQYGDRLQAIVQSTKLFEPMLIEIDSTHSVEQKTSEIVNWICDLTIPKVKRILRVD